MTLHYQDDTVTLHHGDALVVLRTLPDNSVDAVVTDPPYSLSFMSKEWDRFKPAEFQGWCLEWATECLRVLKPGAHMLAFGGTRTWHRLACAVEDAGFEIRDTIAWIYGSGFPKSLDVGAAIDKARNEDRAPIDTVRSWLNAQRVAAGWTHDAINEHFGHARNGGGSSSSWMTNPTSRALPTWEQWQELKGVLGFADDMDAEVWRLNGRKGTPGEVWTTRVVTGVHEVWENRTNYALTSRDGLRRDIPASDDARTWSGWGTSLKPAFEPVVCARKPIRGTVAANVLTYGTGALNIDATRVATDDDRSRPPRTPNHILGGGRGTNLTASPSNPAGRWPANVVLDEHAAAALDEQSGTGGSGSGKVKQTGTRTMRDNPVYGTPNTTRNSPDDYGDSGGASRYFKVIERDAEWAPLGENSTTAASTSAGKRRESTSNNSPTAGSGNKPTDPSPRAERSTTETSTNSTTQSRTSSASPPNGTTTTTSDYVKITAGSKGANTDDASGARSTRRSETSPSVAPAPITATAESAPRHTGASGSSETATSSTPNDEPAQQWATTPDFPTFKYQAKAPTAERPNVDGITHATVKPVDLMRWLVRLVTPKGGGVVLEPFAGSGTTVEACILEHFHCIAIEREATYLPLIEERITRAHAELAAIPPSLFDIPEPPAASVEVPCQMDLFGEIA